MLIVMKADATDAQIAHVCEVITELGFKPHAMPGSQRTAIGITGNQGAVDPTRFESLPGVAEAIRVSKPYKLITLDLRPEKTVVRVGDATIGGDELAIIAGPCAIESHAQAFAVAEAVRRMEEATRGLGVTEVGETGQWCLGPERDDRLQHGLGTDGIAARPGDLERTGPVPERAVPALGVRHALCSRCSGASPWATRRSLSPRWRRSG